MEPFIASTRPGLRFRLFGVPVAIHPSLPFVLALLGLSTGSVARIAIWVVLGTLAVLIHELGHAGAAIALGGRPRVVLAGLGGYTEPRIDRQLSRSRAIGLAFAGPAVGLVVGGIVAVVTVLAGRPEAASLTEYTVIVALWVNIGWSAINLLPVLPLDGGHILTELLPGEPQVRQQRAYRVSTAVAAAAAIALFRYGLVFGGLMFGLLAMMSFRAVGADRVARRQSRSAADLAEVVDRIDAGEDVEDELRNLVRDPHVGATSRTLLVEHLAQAGRFDEARRLSSDLGSGQPPTLAFLVDVLASDGRDGVAALLESFRRSPSALTGRHLVLGLVAADRPDEVARALRALSTGPERLPVLAGAQLAAHQIGEFSLSAELGALTFDLHPDAPPLIAYNTACSLARAGELDNAMQWLEAAVERGFGESRLLDHDEDLAGLRGRAAFTDLRAKVHRL